ncbi:MAG: NAD-dependent epimerase/dehydratase family protein [Nanoarchaeota archaeon]|nr:NAD-dependent epimerase/dehydratase family protein [Nanoarchaeota archaeon]
MILVTGAAGFIGRSLVKKLVDKGHKVKCFVLNGDNNVKKIENLPVKIVYGDILKVETIETALDKVDTVIHLAALVGSPNKSLCYKINKDGTKNVIDACKKKGVKRIIATTSVAATFKHLGAYGKTKLESEKMILSSSLDATLVRPTLVYGKEGLEFEKIVDFVKKLPVVPMVGGGNALKQPVYVDDVASLIVNIIESKDTIGKVYPAGGPDVVTFNKLIYLIGEGLGKKKSIAHIPKWLCYIMAKSLGMVTKNPPITPDQVLEIDEDAIIDNTETILKFKYRPTKLRDGLKLSLK